MSKKVNTASSAVAFRLFSPNRRETTATFRFPPNHNTNWINQNVINCANYIFDNIHVDYPWATHINHYNEICDKLDLDSTNFIHVAKQDGKNVGVAKILEQY